jgi:hypothetical protein
MQYHNMLKQKHETELKAASDHAAKKKMIEENVNAAKQADQAEVDKKKQAELALQELLKAEAREKDSKKAFSGGVKKGFLENKKKKK